MHIFLTVEEVAHKFGLRLYVVFYKYVISKQSTGRQNFAQSGHTAARPRVEMMARRARAITFICSKQNQIQNVTEESWAIQRFI
jgi:hypothetical protein